MIISSHVTAGCAGKKNLKLTYGNLAVEISSSGLRCAEQVLVKSLQETKNYILTNAFQQLIKTNHFKIIYGSIMVYYILQVVDQDCI